MLESTDEQMHQLIITVTAKGYKPINSKTPINNN